MTAKPVKKVVKKTSATAASKRVAKKPAPKEEPEVVKDRYGASVRARCKTQTCEMYLESQIVKLERKGDVYYVPFLLCAKCLCEVEIMNKELREAFQGG